MKRALVLIVAVSVIACSDRRSPTSPTRPTGSAGTPVGTITHVLRGTVTNGAGTPVAGATVEWTGVAEAWGDRGHGVQTNEKGEYRIDIDALPPQGGAIARASKDGYTPVVKLVTIAGDTFLAFTLQTEGRTSAAANGIATWVSILGSRTLCREITTQVGTTYPLWLTMESRGEAVTLKLSHEAPVDDPMAEPPEVFTGTRRGDSITASSQGPMGGLACPTDTSITPQVGGDLEADIAGDRITGRYTETYGTSDEQVTFVFRFEASL